MLDATHHILLLEDEAAHAELVVRAFEMRGDTAHLTVAETLAEARACLAQESAPALIIADWRLPDGEGMDLLNSPERPATPVIIMTSHGNERVAVEALKAGALDYVVKSDTTLVDMPHIAERAIREWNILSERERMQAALRASEERLRAVVTNAPIVFFATDRDGIFTVSEGRGLEVLGLGPGQLVGLSVYDVYRDVPAILDGIQRAMAGEEHVAIVELPAPGLVFETWFAPLYGHNRMLNGVIGVGTDITERKRAEDALRASEQKFFRAFHSSPVGMIIRRVADDRLLDVNEAFCQMVGYTREEAIGHTSIGLGLWIDSEDQQRAQEMFEAQGFLRDLEVLAHHKSGGIRMVSISAATVDVSDEMRTLITVTDVTARKQAESALHQYTERLTILHEIDQAILVAKSIEEIADAALSRIQRAVPSWRSQVVLFDLEKQEAYAVADYRDGQKSPPGRRAPLSDLGPIAALQPGELYVIDDLTQLPSPPPLMQRMIQAGSRTSVDAPLIVLGRQIGLLSLDARQPRHFSAEALEVVREVADQLAVAIQNARLLDQTRRHAQELELRVAERTRELAEANERLTELDRLKSKFVSDVSHELRTPIANLNLHVELLERGRVEKRMHYLTVVRQQARRLGQLVDDILSLSRLEMGKQRVIFGLVDLNDLVDQIVTAHQPRAESANVELTFEPQPELPPVRGEVNQLAQVVTNLISNALNYTPSGYVRVSTCWINGEAGVKVEDTGLGIDPDDIPYIFDRFYRGQRSQRSETPGTGLGLAIVKEIVDLHQGRIEVESGVKRGTTFTVWLPYHV